jgi:cytochrome c-type protein NapC
MKRTDSHECRNCHNFAYMDYAEQNVRSARRHQEAFNAGQTCIDCHKGIAHKLPEIEQHIGAPKEHAAEPPPVSTEPASSAAPGPASDAR